MATIRGAPKPAIGATPSLAVGIFLISESALFRHNAFGPYVARHVEMAANSDDVEHCGRGSHIKPGVLMAIFIGSHVAGRMARGNRRGLSMLELALSLPILLFVMALIVNYGTLAAWKVRDLSVARLAVWGKPLAAYRQRQPGAQLLA